MGTGTGTSWTAGRKWVAVLRLLRGEPQDLLFRKLGFELYLLERWPVVAYLACRKPLKLKTATSFRPS
jgi:hypothetical protein